MQATSRSPSTPASYRLSSLPCQAVTAISQVAFSRPATIEENASPPTATSPSICSLLRCRFPSPAPCCCSAPALLRWHGTESVGSTAQQIAELLVSESEWYRLYYALTDCRA